MTRKEIKDLRATLKSKENNGDSWTKVICERGLLMLDEGKWNGGDIHVFMDALLRECDEIVNDAIEGLKE